MSVCYHCPNRTATCHASCDAYDKECLKNEIKREENMKKGAAKSFYRDIHEAKDKYIKRIVR